MPSVAKRQALDSEIGERLHWWMWRNRVSQVDLARQTGMSQPSLGRKLRGSTPWLASEIRDIAAAIGKPISWLYGDIEDEDSARPKGLEPLTFWSVVWRAQDWVWRCAKCGGELDDDDTCMACGATWPSTEAVRTDDLALAA